MASRWKDFDCEDCGTPTRRRRHREQDLICLDCGVVRAADAARDMFNREGPAWEAHQRALSERAHGASP